jgi:mannose-6-phosphate isomerase-like protein (cupin superfamily)
MSKNDLMAPKVIDPLLIGSKALPAGMVSPVVVEKRWGRELIYANDERYCCKVLHIEPSGSTSLHFHINKHETMLVVDGVLKIDYIVGGKAYSIEVEQTNAFVIPPGLPHKLSSAVERESVTFVETSTISFDSDSIRIGL